MSNCLIDVSYMTKNIVAIPFKVVWSIEGVDKKRAEARGTGLGEWKGDGMGNGGQGSMKGRSGDGTVCNINLSEYKLK